MSSEEINQTLEVFIDTTPSELVNEDAESINSPAIHIESDDIEQPASEFAESVINSDKTNMFPSKDDENGEHADLSSSESVVINENTHSEKEPHETVTDSAENGNEGETQDTDKTEDTSPIKSSEAKPTTESPSHQSNKSNNQACRVYVGNLAYETTSQNLKDFMKPAGNITFGEVLMMMNGKSKGCGIIEFATPEEAKKAIQMLDGKELMGRPVFIREDREAERRTGGQYLSPEGRQVYVANLSYSAAWQDLKDLFREVGSVFRAEIFAGGSATVCFETTDAAKKAIERFDGYEWQGRKMHVKMDERVGGRHHHPNADRRPFVRRDHHHRPPPPPHYSPGGYHRPLPPPPPHHHRRDGYSRRGSNYHHPPPMKPYSSPSRPSRNSPYQRGPPPPPHHHHHSYPPRPNQPPPQRPYYGNGPSAPSPYPNPPHMPQAPPAMTYPGYQAQHQVPQQLQQQQPSYPHMAAPQYNGGRPGPVQRMPYTPVAPQQPLYQQQQQQQQAQQQAQQQQAAYQQYQQAMSYYNYQQAQQNAMRPPY